MNIKKRFTLIKAKHTEGGFTLIELLVVISIIGILAALATVSFTGSQKQARDTQRKSDLRQYQNALEIYANKNNGLYPVIDGTTALAWGTLFCQGYLSTVGITTCPEDPKYDTDDSYSYLYLSDTSGTAYVIWGKLENTTGYWVLCSTGAIGKTTTSPAGSAGVCPDGLQP